MTRLLVCLVGIVSGLALVTCAFGADAPKSYADALEVALPIVWNEEQRADRRFEDMHCRRAGRMMSLNVWSCKVRLVDSRTGSSRMHFFIVTVWGEVLKSGVVR